MAKELMEIGGFITSGAEIVNHDASLSGNGTVDSPLGVVPGYNETVLWSGEKYWWNSTGALNLSESVNNFEIIRIKAKDDWEIHEAYFYVPSNPTNNQFDITLQGVEGSKLVTKSSKFTFSGSSIGLNSYFALELNSAKAMNIYTDRSYVQFQEVVGINRKAQ